MFRRGKLISDSEWMRVYEFDGGTLHESKFLVDGIHVGAEAVRRRWPDLSPEERLEFSLAFQAKPEVTTEDELVLDFLMEAGDLPVWITIAPLLPKHSDRDRALAFLLARIREGHRNANFYQAVEQLNDRRALPVLGAAYDEYERALQERENSGGEFPYLDYLSCCQALSTIEGSPEYREAIERCAQSGDPAVRFWAEALLSGK